MDTGTVTLNHPRGVVADNAGNVYIADTAHHQIVKVTSAGDAIVLTITGLSTGLNSPEGLAIDGSGNVYIADTGNHRIVVVTSLAAGSVVDLGGLTLSSPRGVAIDSSGNLCVADTDNNRIIKLPSGGSAAALNITGLGTALSAPAGLSVDVSGNLYIADSGNNRIVKVTTGGAGSAVSISGLGTALSAPTGVAVDGFANLFIADSGNNRVVQVTSAGVGSVPSTGSLTLNAPNAVAVDISGAIHVADTSNSRVALLMLSAVGFGQLQVGAMSGKSFTLPFTIGVAATLGSVQALTLGAQSLDFTLGAGTTCANGTTNTTCNVEVQFLPLASGLRRGGVALFDQSSTLLAFVPIYGSGGAPLAALSPGTATIVSTGGVSIGSPFGVAIDGAGNLYVGNYTGNNVVKIAAGGGSASVVSTGGLTLLEACGVAVDGAGNLYIADYGHNRIVLVTSTGAASVFTVTGLGTAINQPAALALDGAGNLYIADWGNDRVVKVTPAGAGYVVATGSYTLSSMGVTGVAVDPSGNIYIADRIANHIVKVTPSGAASLVSVTGLTLTNPQGVAVDGNGNLYIADSGHRRVVQVTLAGTASVVQTPGQTIGTIMYGVTTDSNGNIYAVDWSYNRVLSVNVSGAVLRFANTSIGGTSSDSPKTATVTNLGNQALAFSSDTSYTADFSEDSLDASLCSSSTSLEPGETCDVSVLFTPQSAGSLSASLVVTNNHLNGSSATQNVAVSGTGVSPTTPTITWTQPSAIDYGTTLSGILNATATNGASPVAGTFAYTATAVGGTASTVTTATVLGVGIYTLSVIFTPSDEIAYDSASGSVPLTVNKAEPSVLLVSSANPAVLSSSVSFTATVSASASTPTGSVDFYDGTTLLGSGTLQSGDATYATANLSSGTHSITAVYSGDSNFLSVTSSAVSQVVSDVTVNIASGGTRNASVSAGGTATYHLSISPSTGSRFPAAVTLTASGGPVGSTITITPQIIAAGAAATNVTVSVQVPATTAAARRSDVSVLGAAFPLMGILVLCSGIKGRRPLKRVHGAVLLLIAMGSAGVVLGCGNSASTVPQPSTYTITVTATSGSISHSTALSLTVQ
ncbi:MAG TPA: Ig-like domain repeat protein [Candidatus Sulfotelmatobacter sp.]|nr:Ig-like domain repeat protein [Candidatus Sulfotelmatobacter sp.]